MISRRNFFSIIMMMAVLLFLFQFSQIIKVNGNNYDRNEYATENPVSGEKQWNMDTACKDDGTKEIILFCGNPENELGNMVKQWCTYTKHELLVSSEAVYDDSDGILPKMLLIDSESIDKAQIDNIRQMAQEGVTVVFCNLPSTAVISGNKEWKELLGITEVKGQKVEVEGLQLYKGFLLGGEAIYKAQTLEEEKQQDLELEIPWYVTGTGTKTYMVGMMDEDEVEREELPRVIWRNSFEGTLIFCINGDYMSGMTGWGILDAIMYEASPYTLYPVVNAQNMLVIDCPDLSSENAAKMQEIYSRDFKAVLRDVMWPGIVSMSMKNNLKLTCFMNTKYNYTDDARPDGEDVVFYLQQMKEIDAEAGISLNYGEGIDLQEKITSDNAFYQALDSEYKFAALYIENLSEEAEQVLNSETEANGIHSIACMELGDRPLLSYYNDRITVQGITDRAQEYTYSADLQMRSLMTALGYSNVLISMDNVVWPETQEDHWENYFDEIFSNVSTYWSRYEEFSRTTISESDSRLRTFLNLDYEHIRNEDTIFLNISGMQEDAWFLFRTHGEDIAKITNAEFEKIDEDAYLIHADSNEIEICLEKGENILSYPKSFEQ